MGNPDLVLTVREFCPHRKKTRSKLAQNLF
jgi:hypothetical protein